MVGLIVASVLWRLPFIQRLEEETLEGAAAATPDGFSLPGPTHRLVKRVSEFAGRKRDG